MKKNILLAYLIIVIGCSKNPQELNSICTYENVKLDTTNINLNENDILATWVLHSIVDLSDCSVKNRPEEFPEIVVISFNDSCKISGHTGNEFVGNYFLVENKIKININTLTELGEPEWALNFLNAVKNLDYCFIKESKLFIFFNQSTKVMILFRIL